MGKMKTGIQAYLLTDLQREKIIQITYVELD